MGSCSRNGILSRSGRALDHARTQIRVRIRDCPCRGAAITLMHSTSLLVATLPHVGLVAKDGADYSLSVMLDSVLKRLWHRYGSARGVQICVAARPPGSGKTILLVGVRCSSVCWTLRGDLPVSACRRRSALSALWWRVRFGDAVIAMAAQTGVATTLITHRSAVLGWTPIYISVSGACCLTSVYDMPCLPCSARPY